LREKAAEAASPRAGGEMDLQDGIGRLRRWAARRLRPRSAVHVKDFWATPEETARLAAQTPGELAQLFFATRGRMIHKWPHYLAAYERYFAGFRGTPVRMLEIGVSGGGSLDLWRRYFGPAATIFGVDIDPACAGRVDPPNQVRIGSQADPAFLKSVVAEMGGVDIVLDDGSHIARHQLVSFQTLFPALSDGGLYVIEDLQTAYWPDYDGGYRRAGTAIALVRRLIDDMHAWYHRKPTTTSARDEVGAIHVHDATVVIEKRRRAPPRQVRVGP
jgi:cephalosporin hydroxylase